MLSLHPIFLVNDGGKGHFVSKNKACFPVRATYQSLPIPRVLFPEGPSAPHSCLAKPQGMFWSKGEGEHIPSVQVSD